MGQTNIKIHTIFGIILYYLRIANIAQTNQMLSNIRRIVERLPRHQRISQDIKEKIIEMIAFEEQTNGYVDYIIVSSSLMFSMKYVLSLDKMKKETFYNSVKKQNYYLASDYLDGLEKLHAVV